jgi:benzoyl-CoA reductase/2-hydroxyglutaryl-CoA dehydratase subunit BcrC/BadD/HgdB
MIMSTTNSVSSDILRFRSLLDLSLEFVNGREYLRDLKIRKQKHLIGVFMPNVELVCGVGAIPTYPVRMKPFGDPSLLKLLDLGKTLLGDNLLGSLIQTVSKFDTNRSLEKLIRSLIDSIFAQWDGAYHTGVDTGIPSDECYGIKVISGMFIEKGKNLSGALLASVRCSAFEKMYETVNRYSPGLFIDIPPIDNAVTHELAVKEVQKTIESLEKITGTSFDMNEFRKTCEITNECKRLAWDLIQIALGDTYPFSPVTMGEFLSLIEIGFQDYLSNPAKFRDLLRNLVNEIRRIIRSGENCLDVRHLKKILFTSRFSGWDHIVEDYVFEAGGRIIYADWFLYGFMDQIKITGDMVDNYATYLQSNSLGFCPDNATLIEKTYRFVEDNKMDAVIYNQLFGCHSISTGYARLRKKLIAAEIPSTLVSFNNVGENREQLKTRVVGLMELLR